MDSRCTFLYLDRGLELLTTLVRIGVRGSVDPVIGMPKQPRGCEIDTEMAVTFWAGKPFGTAFYRMRSAEGQGKMNSR